MLDPDVMPTHVLFDLDGTLSDSSPGIGASLRHAMRSCGLPEPTAQEVRSVIGPPFEVGLPRIGVPAAAVAQVVEAYRVDYEGGRLFDNDLYDGIPGLLDRLAGTVTLAIATAKPQRAAERIIDHFELTGHFAAVAGATAELGSARRTKAQVIEYVMAELGMAPGPETVMIGDRDHDVDGAIANGIACIGVTWGFGTAVELIAAGATTVVDAPDDVVPALATTYREASR